RVFVDVHLHDLDLVAELAVDLLHDRGDHAARTAPRRPEVDEHRLVGLEDRGLELVVGYFLNVSHVHSLSLTQSLDSDFDSRFVSFADSVLPSEDGLEPLPDEEPPEPL